MNEVQSQIARATAFAAAGPLAADRDRPDLPPLPRDETLVGREALVPRFRAELERLTGKVYGPFDAAGVTLQVKSIFDAVGTREALVWGGSDLADFDLSLNLTAAGIQLILPEVPATDERQATLERLATQAVGLTGAVAGLADTGSIVVASGPGKARLTSLLPPVHVAILPVSRIQATMSDWLATGGRDLVRTSANVVVITGPSRTADIELIISLGVHGPKEVHVVLYDG